jgi:AraC-like DNA-binding protein
MTLAESSPYLAELFDLLDDVLAWMKDRQGRYLWVNRKFLIQYALDHPDADGVTVSDQILGRTDYDLSPAFMADQFRLDDEQVLAGHRIINRIERVGEFEGMTAWNITNKIPVRNAKGAIIGTAGITRTLNRDELPSGTISGFEPVLAYMRDNYHRAITNQQMAAAAKMSQRAFERQFLASFHLTPQKYLRKLRLRIASRALIYTNGIWGSLGALIPGGTAEATAINELGQAAGTGVTNNAQRAVLFDGRDIFTQHLQIFFQGLGTLRGLRAAQIQGAQHQTRGAVVKLLRQHKLAAAKGFFRRLNLLLCLMVEPLGSRI